jgi:hypothetical protein
MSNAADDLVRAIHGECPTNPPDRGKVRQKDKSWEALGISRATWYRQGKPELKHQVWKKPV